MKWLLPFAVLLVLGGCANPFTQDQFAEPGTWQPTYDNDANLRAMVANPHDLVAGEPMEGAVGAEAAGAVDKLVTGKRAKLSDAQASSVYGASSGGSGSGGAGEANGGG